MEDLVFKVRKATINDIPVIMDITKEAFVQYMESAGITEKVQALKEPYEDVKKDIETKEVFIAFLDNNPVGTVRVEIYEDKTAYLSRFAVKKEYQNNGVGKVLMSIVDINMMNLNIKKLSLHTASKILSLVRFYYGRGFYIDSTSNDKGYIRALLCKEYEKEENDKSGCSRVIA